MGAGCAEKNAEGVDIGADGSMAARKQLVLTLKNSWLSVLVESVERELNILFAATVRFLVHGNGSQVVLPPFAV